MTASLQQERWTEAGFRLHGCTIRSGVVDSVVEMLSAAAVVAGAAARLAADILQVLSRFTPHA